MTRACRVGGALWMYKTEWRLLLRQQVYVCVYQFHCQAKLPFPLGGLLLKTTGQAAVTSGTV